MLTITSMNADTQMRVQCSKGGPQGQNRKEPRLRPLEEMKAAAVLWTRARLAKEEGLEAKGKALVYGGGESEQASQQRRMCLLNSRYKSHWKKKVHLLPKEYNEESFSPLGY